MAKETQQLNEAYDKVRRTVLKASQEPVDQPEELQEDSAATISVQLSYEELNRLLHGLHCFRPQPGTNNRTADLIYKLEVALAELNGL